MAFELNLSFQRSLDRTSILVTDLTGSGATGYGGSNPTVGSFTDFNIIVTPTDSVTLLPTGTPVTINAYPSLPSATEGTFTITSLLLLGTADTTIIDGVYLFEVEATSDEEVYTFSGYAVFYEIVECCIQNLTIDSLGCGCSGDSQKIQRLLRANMELRMLQPVVFNGVVGNSPLVANSLWNQAAETLLDLQRICNNSNCKG